MDDRRFKDIVRHGTSKDVAVALFRIRDTVIRMAEWVRTNKPRDERNLVLFNFLKAVVPYIVLAEQHIDGPAQVLALCARSLYELELRVRQVLRSPDALGEWVKESATDRIQLIEGYLELTPEGPQEQRAILEAEVLRLRAVLEERGSQQQRSVRLDQLAKEVGDEQEHRSLFKLYSKLIHPSSYLVNARQDETQGEFIGTLLIVHVQLYAWSLLEEIRTDLAAPEALVACATTRPRNTKARRKKGDKSNY